MSRATAIAFGALVAALALLCAQLATGAAPTGKRTCRGQAVTIAEDRHGDPRLNLSCQQIGLHVYTGQLSSHIVVKIPCNLHS